MKNNKLDTAGAHVGCFAAVLLSVITAESGNSDFAVEELFSNFKLISAN